MLTMEIVTKSINMAQTDHFFPVDAFPMMRKIVTPMAIFPRLVTAMDIGRSMTDILSSCSMSTGVRYSVCSVSPVVVTKLAVRSSQMTRSVEFENEISQVTLVQARNSTL